MANKYLFAGVYAPAAFVLANTSGTFGAAAGATLAIVSEPGSGSPSYYTDKTKGSGASPSFITDANGFAGPYYVDPGNYEVTVTDALGNSHGPYVFNVALDPDEPAFVPVAVTADPANAVPRTLYLANATSAGFTITLPATGLNKGDRVQVKKTDVVAHTVTLACSADIDGATTYAGLTAQYGFVEVTWSGSTWDITGAGTA